MTEVSFYHLQAQPLDHVLPRLLEKVSGRSLRVLVRMQTDALKEHLNTVLWTYSAPSFLAHGCDDADHISEQPILLTTHPDGNANEADVLVLLEDSAASDIADFDRCLYMFDGNDPQLLQAARERWKLYKSEGVDATYWQQDGGGWTKKA